MAELTSQEDAPSGRSARTSGRVIDEARCLMDLAKLLRASGQGDGRADDERARELLSACGVKVSTPVEAR